MVADKVAVVTGGASGIGAALCRLLAESMTVVIADTDLAGAERLRGTITTGSTVEAARLDVSDKAAVNSLLTGTATRYGRLDLVVNSAGVISSGPAHELDWERILAINLGGTINATMSAYSIMRKQGSGQIVNISSLSALCFPPLHLPYVTSKSAVLGFSLALRPEARSYGVRVNAVCPGNVATPMIAGSAVSRFTPPMQPNLAAAEIMAGVNADRSVIVFPFYARMLWGIERTMPFVGAALRQAIVRRHGNPA